MSTERKRQRLTDAEMLEAQVRALAAHGWLSETILRGSTAGLPGASLPKTVWEHGRGLPGHRLRVS